MGAAIAASSTIFVSLVTHVLAPRLLQHYENLPALETIPRLTVNSKGVSADPVNVALVGSETEIRAALRDAAWAAADSLSRRSEFAIARRTASSLNSLLNSRRSLFALRSRFSVRPFPTRHVPAPHIMQSYLGVHQTG